MTKDFRATQQSVVEGAAALRDAIPDVIKGFSALGAGTYKPGALDPKIKELIALALAIGGHCDGCIAYHAKAAQWWHSAEAKAAQWWQRMVSLVRR